METEILTNESIKLMKMSKGYQWEIRINPIPCNDGDKVINRLGETDIDRLKMFNERMKKEFGESGLI